MPPLTLSLRADDHVSEGYKTFKRKSNLPESLEGHEVQGLLDLTPQDECQLLMMNQWRAYVGISEALALQVRDVQLDTVRPTLRVRRGKGQQGPSGAGARRPRGVSEGAPKLRRRLSALQ